MTKNEVLEKLKLSKSELFEKFKISKIGLFGSYAKSTFIKNSDIDLLYHLQKDYRLGFKEVYDLEIYIKNLLNTDNIDLVNNDYLNPIIENEIEKSIIYV